MAGRRSRLHDVRRACFFGLETNDLALKLSTSLLVGKDVSHLPRNHMEAFSCASNWIMQGRTRCYEITWSAGAQPELERSKRTTYLFRLFVYCHSETRASTNSPIAFEEP